MRRERRIITIISQTLPSSSKSDFHTALLPPATARRRTLSHLLPHPLPTAMTKHTVRKERTTNVFRRFQKDAKKLNQQKQVEAYEKKRQAKHNRQFNSASKNSPKQDFGEWEKKFATARSLAQRNNLDKDAMFDKYGRFPKKGEWWGEDGDKETWEKKWIKQNPRYEGKETPEEPADVDDDAAADDATADDAAEDESADEEGDA
jgi:hypothetical protein